MDRQFAFILKWQCVQALTDGCWTFSGAAACRSRDSKKSELGGTNNEFYGQRRFKSVIYFLRILH